jgi:hypothetical protein
LISEKSNVPDEEEEEDELWLFLRWNRGMLRTAAVAKWATKLCGARKTLETHITEIWISR